MAVSGEFESARLGLPSEDLSTAFADPKPATETPDRAEGLGGLLPTLTRAPAAPRREAAPAGVEPTAVVKHGELPGFRPPSASQAPEDQLEALEQGMAEAQVAIEAVEERLEQHWILVAGQSLNAIAKGKLYRHRGFKTFDAYALARWKRRRSQVYRLIDGAKVLLVMGDDVRGLRERQLRELVPVLKASGPEAVREVWKTALESGRTSGPQLEALRESMGFGVELPTQAKAVTPPDAGRILTQFQRLDVRAFLGAADDDPDKARRMIAGMRQTLDTIEAQLPQNLNPPA